MLHRCVGMQRQAKQRSSSGPALPSKLSKEIGAGNSDAGPRNERVSKAFALADRKAQRKAKRQQKGQQRLRFTQNLPQDSSSARPPGKASKKRQLVSGQEVCSAGVDKLGSITLELLLSAAGSQTTCQTCQDACALSYKRQASCDQRCKHKQSETETCQKVRQARSQGLQI